MTALALAGVAALAVGLRLTDALSTSVIPAEDPYTHLGLTREHLRDGHLDDLDGQGDPYPPGLHALLAVVHVTSGVPLDDLVRFGPAAFGVLLVAGVALLVGRLEGWGAAIVAAAAVAVTPEVVFRQSMMAPTAVDLALLPFTLLSLIHVVRGRLAWAAPAAILLAFLVVAHPWSFGILGLAGVAFLLLAALAPWSDGPGLTAGGLALGLLLLGSASALALSGCWGACGPGFTVLEEGTQTDLDLDALAMAIGGTSLVIAGALAAGRRSVQRGLDGLRPLGRTAALVVGIVLAGAAFLVVSRAKQGGYPNLVDPEAMLGWPLVFLGIAGLLVVPFARRPGAHAAAALVAATLPFTLFDPFHSPFWSHRTAAYLGVALACSVGCAAGWVARMLGGYAATAAAEAKAKAAAGDTASRPGLTWARAIGPGLIVAVLLSAGLVTAAPPHYPPWYRLHDDCEAAALRDIAAQADANPRLTVDTGSWQTRLMLAATADNASRIWYQPDLMTNAARQKDLVSYSDGTHRPVLIVVDRQALANAKGPVVEPSSDSWSLAGTWPCPTPVTAYAHTPK